jgi:hypothetical protein
MAPSSAVAIGAPRVPAAETAAAAVSTVANVVILTSDALL